MNKNKMFVTITAESADGLCAKLNAIENVNVVNVTSTGYRWTALAMVPEGCVLENVDAPQRSPVALAAIAKREAEAAAEKAVAKKPRRRAKEEDGAPSESEAADAPGPVVE